MNEADWQEYRNSTYESMIAIETTFNPTLEITEDIANTTLEDLIKQNKGKYSKEELLQKEQNIKRIMKEEGYEFYRWDINPENRMEVICEGRKYDKDDNVIDKTKITATAWLIKQYMY